MTTNSVSKEQIEAMIAGLEGVTTGPYEPVRDYDFQTDPLAVLQPSDVKANGGQKIANFYGPARAKNAEAFARCDPDTMRSILTELLSLRTSSGGVTSGEVVAWSLVFNESYGLNAETTFKHEDRAKEYAERCSNPKPRVIALVPLSQLQAMERDLVDKAAENNRNAEGFAFHAARAEKERAARITAEASLAAALKALQAAEERDNAARFRANSPRQDAEVVHLRTSAISSARAALAGSNGE